MNEETQLHIASVVSSRFVEVGGKEIVFARFCEVMLRCMWKMHLTLPTNLTDAQTQIDRDMLPWFRGFIGVEFQDSDLITYMHTHKLNLLEDDIIPYIHSRSFEKAIDEITNVKTDDPVVVTLRELWLKWQPRIANLSPGLIGSIKNVSQEYIIWLKHHPNALEKMAWEAFEKLIADIFSDKGFRVELTGRIRNRSADLIAVRTDEFGVETKYLIECKRYSSDSHVGFDIVNGVIGAASRADVDHAFLITSSFFTSDVKRSAQELRELRLHLRDGDDVREWLKNYIVKEDHGLWLSSDWDKVV